MFVDRCRSTLQCATRAEVLGSGYRLSREHSVAFLPFGTRQVRNLLPLRRRGFASSFLFELALDYRVETLPDSSFYSVVVSRYMYSLQDVTQRELLAFHWHPSGRSGVVTPHLHVSAARPIEHFVTPLGQETASLVINRAHLPPGLITLEDIVEMLISDSVFAVEPRRADWRQVVATNRAALEAR